MEAALAADPDGALPLLQVEAEADRLQICDTLHALQAAAHEPAPATPAAAQAAAEFNSVDTKVANPDQAQADDAALALADGSKSAAEASKGVIQMADAADADPGVVAPRSDAVAQPAGAAGAAEVALTAEAAGAAGTAAAPGTSEATATEAATASASAPIAVKPASPKEGDAAKRSVKRAMSTKESAEASKAAAKVKAAKAAAQAKYGKVLAKYAAPPEVICGHYVCDFAHIVKGCQASKRFMVQNVSSQAVQLAIDKMLLEAYGCSIGPDKLPKLAGAPDCAATELTLSLNTGLSHVFAGKMEYQVPLLIKAGGPPALITVRANVVVPEVTVSQSMLNFGTVPWGMSKVIVLRLRNARAVPAEWAFRKPLETPQAINWDFYRCEPANGVVAPNSHTDVKVFFTPDHPSNHGDDYPQDLPLRISNNPRAITIAAKGSSVLYRVRVAPKELDLGAALPALPDGAAEPIRADFSIKNKNDAPIEVVAVDFDERVAQEEAMLSEWQVRTQQACTLQPAALWAG